MNIIKAEPVIDNPRRLPFPAGGEVILAKMFGSYGRVVVEKEFGGGNVFLVHPIKRNGMGEHPAIVKIASSPCIQQEWEAYQGVVLNRWPDRAWVNEAPFTVPGNEWAALRYPLVGSGKFAIDSLATYTRRAGLADLRFVFEEQLPEVIKTNHLFSETYQVISWQTSFDHLLPANLSLRPLNASSSNQPSHHITSDKLPSVFLNHGDRVRLERFVVTGIEARQDSVTLGLPPGGRAMSRYRVLLQPPPESFPYQLGQVVPTVEGSVIETRYERLQAEVSHLVTTGTDLTASTLLTPLGRDVGNPLLYLHSLSTVSRLVRVGCIHGNLSLANILIAPATREVNLINFSQARHDHLLYDFLQMETEIITHYLPELLGPTDSVADLLYRLYEQLHLVNSPISAQITDVQLLSRFEKPLLLLLAIRKMAAPHLLEPYVWSEYYQGLLHFLMAAVALEQLSRVSRQVAFWAAAASARFTL